MPATPKSKSKVLPTIDDVEEENKVEKRTKKNKQNGQGIVTKTLNTVSFLFLGITSIPLAYLMIHLPNTTFTQFIGGYQDKKLVAYACVAIAFALTWITALIKDFALFFQSPQGWGSDRDPRKTFSRDLVGWGSRAYASHHNSLEAFPAFAIGVWFAFSNNIDPLLIAKISVAFIAFRLAYHVVYILPLPGWVRSSIWMAGFLLNASLYLLPFFPNIYKSTPAQIVGVEAINAFNNIAKPWGVKI
eukprot:TRINITY_DN1046_c0_g1_i2.p1 TRINITY_DN1046_c0_g1~~TRINITY_DN1046_c0_g1_i2.p1  ORF type:complete len:245 (-),score=75.86 TRINITY_DN1046_c0_g1_i2:23-757(-)